MTDTLAHPPIAQCPWCRSADGLKLSGDGLGAVVVCCSLCGCKGPPARIEGDFDQTDRHALQRWSSRDVKPPLDADLVQQVRTAVQLHRMMGSGIDEHAFVSVPYAVLERIIAGAGDAPAAGAARA